MKKMMPVMLIMLILVVGGFYFAWQGVAMHMQVDTDETAFHEVQADYYSHTKVERDSAQPDSELTAQLVEIQQTPSALLQLKLVGVGKILTGIFLLLFGILIALVMMPVRLGKIIKK